MKRNLRMIASLSAIGFALVGAIAVAPVSADITGGAFIVTATNEAGDAASFMIDAPVGAQSWVWTSTDRVELRSPTTGALIAVLNPDGRESGVEYIDDPVISLAFSVLAGPSPTTFSIASALLSFAPLTAEGRASVGMSLTDGDGDGATLTGIGDPAGSMGAYLAQYNGYAGTLSGTTFAESIPSITAGAFATSTVSADTPPVGFLPIVAPVSDMSVLVSFRLTANDLASGTSVFVIQQRPLAVEPSTWGQIKSLFE